METRIEQICHTFFARFLRSLRSLRFVFGGAVVRPD